MVLEQLRSNTVTLPVLGAVSLLTVGIVGVVAFFLLRRKKSVKLTL